MTRRPFIQTRVFYAGLFSDRPTKWLARFRSGNEQAPRKLASLLWPAEAGEQLQVWPAHSSKGKLAESEGGIDMRPAGEIDCPAILSRRLAGEIEAANLGFKGAMICAFCGCWENHACAGGCWWVAAELCSACCRRYGVNPIIRAQLEPEGWESAHVVAPLTGGQS